MVSCCWFYGQEGFVGSGGAVFSCHGCATAFRACHMAGGLVVLIKSLVIAQGIFLQGFLIFCIARGGIVGGMVICIHGIIHRLSIEQGSFSQGCFISHVFFDGLCHNVGVTFEQLYGFMPFIGYMFRNAHGYHILDSGKRLVHSTPCWFMLLLDGRWTDALFRFFASASQNIFREQDRQCLMAEQFDITGAQVICKDNLPHLLECVGHQQVNMFYVAFVRCGSIFVKQSFHILLLERLQGIPSHFLVTVFVWLSLIDDSVVQDCRT